jgi:hypothetical protein
MAKQKAERGLFFSFDLSKLIDKINSHAGVAKVSNFFFAKTGKMG